MFDDHKYGDFAVVQGEGGVEFDAELFVGFFHEVLVVKEDAGGGGADFQFVTPGGGTDFGFDFVEVKKVVTACERSLSRFRFGFRDGRAKFEMNQLQSRLRGDAGEGWKLDRGGIRCGWSRLKGWVEGT